MIEDMFDDELGIISASRVYVCEPKLKMYAALPMASKYEHHDGTIDDDALCMWCERGPVLWDQWRQSTYVLVPFFIQEQP